MFAEATLGLPVQKSTETADTTCDSGSWSRTYFCLSDGCTDNKSAGEIEEDVRREVLKTLTSEVLSCYTR